MYIYYLIYPQPPRRVIIIPTLRMRKVFTKRPFPHLPSPNPSFEARLAQKPPFLGPISSALHWSISLPPWGGGATASFLSPFWNTPPLCVCFPHWVVSIVRVTP